jgi:hypothetical protein
MLKKVIPIVAMLCVSSVPILASANQPLGCAISVPASNATPVFSGGPVHYRSNSYQPGTSVNGYRPYSMPHRTEHTRSYENAVNKSLGRVN